MCLTALAMPLTLRTIGAAEGTASRLNVLFLMTDEHHFRALSLAGCPYIQTPNLDRIGAKGLGLPTPRA